jgi:cytochrome c peroxidase
MQGQQLKLVQVLMKKYSDRLPPTQVGLPWHLMGVDPSTPLTGWDVTVVQTYAALAYKVMAAYLMALNSTRAPFDLYAQGDRAALTPAQKRGLKLFIGKAGCIECHSGPAFNGVATARSERDFYRSVGIAQRGPNVDAVDTGRASSIGLLLKDPFNSGGQFNDARDPDGRPRLNRVAGLSTLPGDEGRFRIKGLRQVAKTAPYMHAGQLDTLADVVRFYNLGGDSGGFSGTRDRLMVPLGLTPDEELDLVAFMESLTGAPIPPSLTCNNARGATGSNLCGYIP